jgi:hypothetical protein
MVKKGTHQSLALIPTIMSEVCKAQAEVESDLPSNPEESEVSETRGKVACLSVVSHNDKKEQNSGQYLARHPELWLSGF